MMELDFEGLIGDLSESNICDALTSTIFGSHERHAAHLHVADW